MWEDWQSEKVPVYSIRDINILACYRMGNEFEECSDWMKENEQMKAVWRIWRKYQTCMWKKYSEVWIEKID